MLVHKCLMTFFFIEMLVYECLITFCSVRCFGALANKHFNKKHVTRHRAHKQCPFGRWFLGEIEWSECHKNWRIRMSPKLNDLSVTETKWSECRQNWMIRVSPKLSDPSVTNIEWSECHGRSLCTRLWRQGVLISSARSGAEFCAKLNDPSVTKIEWSECHQN